MECPHIGGHHTATWGCPDSVDTNGLTRMDVTECCRQTVFFEELKAKKKKKQATALDLTICTDLTFQIFLLLKKKGLWMCERQMVVDNKVYK